ncbi:MAG: tripartite tricarboxylate transporter substrate binding protein [Betaproteobacteria bacterium]|jgi:tripartite-type tricarboxylate transporter receptor subunit TctC
MKRRILISLSTALVLAGLCTVAHADGDWPKQGIRLVVPFTAGSGTDIIARAVGERLGQALGQSVTIDNRPGAGGTVAANQVAKAAPDGYTLLVHSSGHVVNPSLYPNLPYDTLKDLAGITTLASLPNVMVVSPAKGYKDVKDLVAKVKQKPEGFYYASAGNGSATHINGEKFRLAAGISPTHVPYRGTPEALTDTMAGRIDWFFAPIVSALPLVKEGRLQALAVGTPMRSDDLPNVPTTAEAGFAGSEYTFWVGMLAPAATPKSVIDRLNQEVLKILNNKEFKNRLDVIGATSMPMAPAAFDHFIKVETEATSKLVNAAGIKAN